MTTQLEKSEIQSLRNEGQAWYNKWVENRPFESHVFVIQTIVDFFYKSHNNEALQEIRDILEEIDLPLTLVDAWLINSHPLPDTLRTDKP